MSRQVASARLAAAALATAMAACAAAEAPADPDASSSAGAEADAATAADARPMPDAALDDAAAPDAAPSDARPACAGGARSFEEPSTGHCYVLFTDALEWADAAVACASQGPDWHLASALSAQENAILAALVGVSRRAWIGLSDIDDEGTFVWVDGSPFEFENWRPREPNDAGGDEDCAALFGDDDATWVDTECDGERNHVCERD